MQTKSPFVGNLIFLGHFHTNNLQPQQSSPRSYQQPSYEQTQTFIFDNTRLPELLQRPTYNKPKPAKLPKPMSQEPKNPEKKIPIPSVERKSSVQELGKRSELTKVVSHPRLRPIPSQKQVTPIQPVQPKKFIVTETSRLFPKKGSAHDLRPQTNNETTKIETIRVEQIKEKSLDYEEQQNYYNQQREKLQALIKRQKVERKEKEIQQQQIQKPLQLKELEDYNIGPILGQGSYAVVKVAVNKLTNEKVAIKLYDKSRLFDPQRSKNVGKEIEILKSCDHPNIIKLIKVIETKKHINLIMEYGGAQSIKQLIKQQKHIPEEEAKKIFKGLIKGIRYLHSINVVHRDIKMENILINDDKKVKLIDLGFATILPPERLLTQSCGTPPYMSPEMLPPFPRYSQLTDIWSCGVVLYVMIYGKFPFRATTEKDLFQKIKKQSPSFESHLGQVNQVLKVCLDKDQNERTNSIEILKSKWFQIIN